MSVPFLSRRFAVVAILATLIAGLAVVPAAADAGPGSSRRRRPLTAPSSAMVHRARPSRREAICPTSSMR